MAIPSDKPKAPPQETELTSVGPPAPRSRGSDPGPVKPVVVKSKQEQLKAALEVFGFM